MQLEDTVTPVFGGMISTSTQDYQLSDSLSMKFSPLASSAKRQSLPSDFKPFTSDLSRIDVDNKRKRVEGETSQDSVLKQRKTNGHKRSQTLGNSAVAFPHHGFRHRLHRLSPQAPKQSSSTLLSNTMLKQARNGTPNVKSDTTHTDYFRLKALGINPNTPRVPLTKKQKSTSGTTHSAERVTKSAQMNPQVPNGHTNGQNKEILDVHKSENQSRNDDDEAFFASIRTIRDTLADSTCWFQAERQSLERSMTPQTQRSEVDAPSSSKHTETAAERRLREIRERGHTPSRSEIRLRALGDKAALPKGFWDGEGTGTSSYGQGKVQQRPASAMEQNDKSMGLGFAALSNRTNKGNGDINGHWTPGLPTQTGASVDEAIEL